LTAPDGQARFRYKWDDTTVQIYLMPKTGGKVSIVATNLQLADSAAVEERREQWRDALRSLADLLSA
jgi:hypothetical protein